MVADPEPKVIDLECFLRTGIGGVDIRSQTVPRIIALLMDNLLRVPGCVSD